METMRQYVVRRAGEVKRYREVAEKTKLGYEWLCKLARDLIEQPGVDRVEKLYHYYRSLEKKRKS